MQASTQTANSQADLEGFSDFFCRFMGDFGGGKQSPRDVAPRPGRGPMAAGRDTPAGGAADDRRCTTAVKRFAVCGLRVGRGRRRDNFGGG